MLVDQMHAIALYITVMRRSITLCFTACLGLQQYSSFAVDSGDKRRDQWSPEHGPVSQAERQVSNPVCTLCCRRRVHSWGSACHRASWWGRCGPWWHCLWHPCLLLRCQDWCSNSGCCCSWGRGCRRTSHCSRSGAGRRCWLSVRALPCTASCKRDPVTATALGLCSPAASILSQGCCSLRGRSWWCGRHAADAAGCGTGQLPLWLRLCGRCAGWKGPAVLLLRCQAAVHRCRLGSLLTGRHQGGCQLCDIGAGNPSCSHTSL